jgi:hypothetical protein
MQADVAAADWWRLNEELSDPEPQHAKARR